MFLKQKVQLWKEKKQQEAAAAAERQRELAEKQQRATQLAEKRKQEERERKRQELEAYKQRKQAPSADREQSGARLSRQQLEARHALAKRREADILAAKERYEQRKPKEAVPYLATGDDEVYVKSTSHFADPTTSSMQRQEARPSDRLPLEGTKDAWLNPAAQERWQAVAHVHSSVYRPHTSTASWCGRTFQL
ncbi:hypothetical protein AGDE_14150 [Angomonas deanei]|uniref:Uncharacterized protein n=1 Tax=Angomonas deanei TaxID=59799 RepID=A0A7G2BZ64_9TRYP|nr:hypothetical protein AGDE_14150 [Angomonas deanei]CAD2212730.1 hypothetical protein, conserved [Angomonas deanei]|eukprot:EPY21340.1 hypothetical protein AGDE_14150 [Angomonas deanei]